MGKTRADWERFVQRNHDDAIALHRSIYFDYPPEDHGCYVYTYYDGNGYPIYHGYTTNARTRAKEHWRKAPWASWAEDVRYRPCPTPHAARKLERRLQEKVPSLSHNVITRSFHGADWSDLDREAKVNHVGGYCKLPGGLCDVGYWLDRAESPAETEAA